MCTLLENDIENSQDAQFLQLESKFQRYKSDILGLSKIRKWTSGAHSSIAPLSYCTLKSLTKVSVNPPIQDGC